MSNVFRKGLVRVDVSADMCQRQPHRFSFYSCSTVSIFRRFLKNNRTPTAYSMLRSEYEKMYFYMNEKNVDVLEQVLTVQISIGYVTLLTILSNTKSCIASSYDY